MFANLDDEEAIPMGNLQDDLALSGDEDDLDDEDQDLGISASPIFDSLQF